MEKILKEIGFDPQLENLLAEKIKDAEFVARAQKLCDEIFALENPAVYQGLWQDGDEEEALLYPAVYLVRAVWLKEFMQQADMPEKHLKDALVVLKNMAARSYRKYGVYGLNNMYRSFPIGYFEPIEFVVGRLTFEMGKFNYPFEVYDVDGEYIPIALAGEKFVDGKPVSKKYEGDAFVTEVSYDGDSVSGYTYNADGEIIPEKRTFKGKKVLGIGDNILHVHISSEGKLLDEDVKKSFAEAPAFFAKYFPKYDFKAFVCSSWLLDTGLKNVMKPESNILQFQKNFRIALGSENGFALYWNIFGIEDFLPLDELTPTNGFQKRTLDYLKAGNKLYSGKGFIMR